VSRAFIVFLITTNIDITGVPDEQQYIYLLCYFLWYE